MNVVWIASALFQAALPAPALPAVALTDGGFCAWPLWVTLRDGETATQIEYPDAREIRITARDGKVVTISTSGNGVGLSTFRSGDFVDVRADGTDRWQVRRQPNQVTFRYVFQSRDPRVARFSEPILSVLAVWSEGLNEDWLQRLSSRADAASRCGQS